MPLAVFMRTGWPLLKSSPMRCASAADIAMVVAPVSSMKLTARPLIAPCAMKCPPLLTGSTMRVPPPPEPPLPPMLTGVSMRSATRLPPASTVACSPCSDTSFTPWKASPTASVLGAPPFTIRIARLPMVPVSVTDWACAKVQAAASSSGMSAFIGRGLVAEVIKRQGHVRHVFLDQCHGRLQVVALGAGDAHRVALDRGLHLELAVLDQALDLLRGLGLDAVLDLDDLLDLVAADLLDI